MFVLWKQYWRFAEHSEEVTRCVLSKEQWEEYEEIVSFWSPVCFQEHNVHMAFSVDNPGDVCLDLCGQTHVHLPARAGWAPADSAPPKHTVLQPAPSGSSGPSLPWKNLPSEIFLESFNRVIPNYCVLPKADSWNNSAAGEILAAAPCAKCTMDKTVWWRRGVLQIAA